MGGAGGGDGGIGALGGDGGTAHQTPHELHCAAFIWQNSLVTQLAKLFPLTLPHHPGADGAGKSGGQPQAGRKQPWVLGMRRQKRLFAARDTRYTSIPLAAEVTALTPACWLQYFHNWLP